MVAKTIEQEQQRSLVHKIKERHDWTQFSMQLPCLPYCSYDNTSVAWTVCHTTDSPTVISPQTICTGNKCHPPWTSGARITCLPGPDDPGGTDYSGTTTEEAEDIIVTSQSVY